MSRCTLILSSFSLQARITSGVPFLQTLTSSTLVPFITQQTTSSQSVHKGRILRQLVSYPLLWIEMQQDLKPKMEQLVVDVANSTKKITGFKLDMLRVPRWKRTPSRTSVVWMLGRILLHPPRQQCMTYTAASLTTRTKAPMTTASPSPQQQEIQPLATLRSQPSPLASLRALTKSTSPTGTTLSRTSSTVNSSATLSSRAIQSNSNRHCSIRSSRPLSIAKNLCGHI